MLNRIHGSVEMRFLQVVENAASTVTCLCSFVELVVEGGMSVQLQCETHVQTLSQWVTP